jgi:hypothetical protein
MAEEFSTEHGAEYNEHSDPDHFVDMVVTPRHQVVG